jgi:hypothetical protein
MSSDEDISDCSPGSPYNPYTPAPPVWAIVWDSESIPIDIVCVREALDCVGGHAVLSAVYPTSIHTSFFGGGVLTRTYNDQQARFAFEHDPTSGPEDGSGNVALWPDGHHTHVFHPLLYKDIEDYWRFDDLPIIG